MASLPWRVASQKGAVISSGSGIGFPANPAGSASRGLLGLDKPVLSQYVTWTGKALRGDLGRSLWSDQPVRSLLWDRFVPTLELALLAFVMANIVALVLGVLSAARQDSLVDYVLRMLSI